MPQVKAENLPIAGLVPFSTVDWPGHITASVFIQGCPWKCAYCHNFAILDTRTPGAVPFEKLIDLLERRSGVLDGVVFSGGEATRSQALIPAARQIRKMGFKIGIHSAGAFPNTVKALIDESLIDWVGLDVKAVPEKYDAVVLGKKIGDNPVNTSERLVNKNTSWKKVEETLNVLLESVKNGALADFEVRTTVFPDTLGTCTSAADALFIAKDMLRRGVKKFALQVARSIGTQNSQTQKIPENPAQQWIFDCNEVAKEIEKLAFDVFELRN